jgi:hypothetical protein
MRQDRVEFRTSDSERKQFEEAACLLGMTFSIRLAAVSTIARV